MVLFLHIPRLPNVLSLPSSARLAIGFLGFPVLFGLQVNQGGANVLGRPQDGYDFGIPWQRIAHLRRSAAHSGYFVNEVCQLLWLGVKPSQLFVQLCHASLLVAPNVDGEKILQVQ